MLRTLAKERWSMMLLAPALGVSYNCLREKMLFCGADPVARYRKFFKIPQDSDLHVDSIRLSAHNHN